MTSELVGDAAAPGEVVRERLKEVRKQRRLSPTLAAERYADPAMSATVLMNIEANRRRAAVSIDELIRFAYVYDVPLLSLLIGPDRPIRITGDVVADPAEYLRWMRGEQPLTGTDASLYQAAAAPLAPDGRTDQRQSRHEEFMSWAREMYAGFLAGGEDLEVNTREQVRDTLTEIRGAVDSGASADDLRALIDNYLSRLG